jgi:6-pyruvoyltetrahydropterin/6-carboxytetrahydropterin synthase
MYRLCLRRSFEARHFLIGGDWGAENAEHAHGYRVEWTLAGPALDEHGFLADLALVESALTRVLDPYRGALLNSLPRFAGLNPSLDRFARILASDLSEAFDKPGVRTERVRLWETDSAWAEWENGTEK